jgi:hypothetical protein
MAHRVPSSEDASSTNVTFCPLSIFPMSRSVPSSSGRDANDYASGSRNTNFKPLVLGEIQAVGDTRRHVTTVLRFVCSDLSGSQV